jgi:hypothetical protein
MPNRPQKPRKPGFQSTPLKQHTREGSLLIPPFAKMGASTVSWMNDRLPEMVWAALIIAGLGRTDAIAFFRYFLQQIANNENRDALSNVWLSDFAKLTPQLREFILNLLTANLQTRKALSPLLLFESLPARPDWQVRLPEPDEQSVGLLMHAVGLTLYHQTQEATDCRWVSVAAQVVSGRFQMPNHGEQLKQVLEYPNYGDLREVRPMIRSAEMIRNPMEPIDLTWPHAFWAEAWAKTPCHSFPRKGTATIAKPGTTVNRISETKSLLKQHWVATHSTTAIDAKHDAVFGIAFYGLRILGEVIQIGGGTTILSRLGLRSILEALITLHYLKFKNSDDLWKSWRVYGAGQAKLNSLKMDETPPEYISAETLREIANEDVMEEFVSIKLGHWTNSDLRSMAQTCGMKELYDRYYSWSSGFGHAQWGAVRESVFETCSNPLHRLHRYPHADNPLNEMVPDAVMLADLILEDVSAIIPVFLPRLALPSGK